MSDNRTIDKPVPAADYLTATDAAALTLNAARKRASVAELPFLTNPMWIAQEHAEADGIDALAARLRDPEHRNVRDLRPALGGEVVPLPHADAPGRSRDAMHTARQSPDLLAVDAGLERIDLARSAGVLTLALETAESVGADGAVEKMLAHQMAASHKLTMRLMASADGELHRHERNQRTGTASGALADSTRSALAAARLMDAFARSALVLDRLRNGGRQTVTVQHVTVADGGQAVVAGSVTPGGSVAAPTPGPGGYAD